MTSINNIWSHLLPSNQSGFKPKDSCRNQILSISHEILNLLKTDLKSQAFSLIYLDVNKYVKTKRSGINLLNTLINFRR